MDKQTRAQTRAERKAAIERLDAARDRLEEVSRRDRYESADYLAANKAVIEAEKHVPWWRR